MRKSMGGSSGKQGREWRLNFLPIVRTWLGVAVGGCEEQVDSRWPVEH